jgi:hypothetical protein
MVPIEAVPSEGTGTPAWVDPMLDELDASLELAASLVTSRSVGASALGGPPTPPTAPLGAQARLVDACSPPTMVHLNFADAEASGVEAEAPRRTATTRVGLTLRLLPCRRRPWLWIYAL